jgi:peptide/nickel transport system permease protein
MVLRSIARHLIRLTITVLVAGLLGATAVRWAPAFGVDESEIDPRFNRESIDAIRTERSARTGIVQFYAAYLRNVAHGDLGFSPSMNRPVVDLLRDRLPVSLRNLAIGTGLGITLGMAAAFLAASSRSPWFRLVPATAGSVLLAIPSAALALVFLILGWPGTLALAALVFPRVFRYSFAALARWMDAPHVVAARARGLSPWRVLVGHTLPVAAPQLLAVCGMAVSIAFPALVPIEAVCDSPGAMQLAWKAALARDLPVLVGLTMIAAMVVSLGNAAADLSADAARRIP